MLLPPSEDKYDKHSFMSVRDSFVFFIAQPNNTMWKYASMLRLYHYKGLIRNSFVFLCLNQITLYYVYASSAHCKGHDITHHDEFVQSAASSLIGCLRKVKTCFFKRAFRTVFFAITPIHQLFFVYCLSSFRCDVNNAMNSVCCCCCCVIWLSS